LHKISIVLRNAFIVCSLACYDCGVVYVLFFLFIIKYEYVIFSFLV